MRGKGNIAIEIAKQANYVHILVSDSGHGIPRSNHQTIFNPGVTSKKRGWGLGLSLAKRIVENYHKGKIYVKRSAIDQGTTITVRLPEVDS